MTHDDDASLLLPTELQITIYGLAGRIIPFWDSKGQNFSNFNEYRGHLSCLLNKTQILIPQVCNEAWQSILLRSSQVMPMVWAQN